MHVKFRCGLKCSRWCGSLERWRMHLMCIPRHLKSITNSPRVSLQYNINITNSELRGRKYIEAPPQIFNQETLHKHEAEGYWCC
ncbi:hypothetical protein TNCV_3938401 [Trichonephila clavipes]|nr:hypothetical protein TNCV_3938401 [Trichonephila clavipes]